MVKFYCDHCGAELNSYTNEIDYEECYRDGDSFVGDGCILCDDCYDLRQRLHMELDKEFFHIGE